MSGSAPGERVAHDAGRLLAKALQPKLRPSRDPSYADLLQRYRTDAEYRTVVRAVADGLGLRVLGQVPTGLVLACADDSPFALRLGDYRQNLTVEQRVVHGLVQLAIAAWCFPSAEDLADDEGVVRDVRVAEVAEWLIGLCQRLEAEAEVDPELGNPELREAFRAVLAKASTRRTPDGRRSASTLDGAIAYALERLERGGLMRRAREGWKSTRAYRLQVRDLAGHEAYEAVVRAART